MSGVSAAAATWRDVLGLCARYWGRRPGRLGLVAGLLLLTLAADLSVPLSIGAAVAAIAQPQADLAAASPWLGALAAALAAQALFRWRLDRAWNRVTVGVMTELQGEAFGRVQRFSTDWHASTFAGATVHKLSRARWSIDMIGHVLWIRLGTSILMMIGISAALGFREPLAGLAFAVLAGLYLWTNIHWSNKYVRPANIASAQAESRTTAAIADAIANNAAVKSFGAEAREDARLGVVLNEARAAGLRSLDASMDLTVVQQLIWAAAQVSVLAVLGLAAGRGALSAGDMAFAAAANVQLSGNLRAIGGDIRMLQRAFGEFAEAIEFFTAQPQVRDAAAPLAFRPARGAIAFDRVRFGYGDGAALYEEFNLKIAPGERVGLVGPSGSGKSTFVKLVQRLYDLDGGRILIDGVDIAEVPQAELRRAIAAVPQDPALFHRTLAENIAYARPEADQSEIIAAAKRARAHEFILAAPKGYDTLVGERGVKLSGGERQRIALARAFLADAPILILDEATSSLDTLTERLIQEAIEELMAGRTSIVIAHRLSTVRRVDRILVFDRGRIVEQGAHGELMARAGGRYRQLHELQGEHGVIG